MRKVLFCILLSVMVLGVSAGNGIAQTPPPLNVSLEMNKPVYLKTDPIVMAITLENEGYDLITSEGFIGEPFHLFLTFISPNGSGIAAHKADTREGLNPPVFPVKTSGVVEMVQMLPVEAVPGTPNVAGAFLLTVNITDAHALYNLNEVGNYSVKAIVDIRTYPDINITVDGVDYAELDPVDFQGVIESNTVFFTILDDADEDGHLSDVDCDDNDALVNPGAIEIPDNGKDDDCDTGTPDVVAIAPGTINVKTKKFTINFGTRPIVTREPIAGMVVRAFDMTNQCVSDLGVSWQYYEAIWIASLCTHAAYGVTGADGTASLSVPPGNYIVIGKYDPDNTVTGDERYIGRKAYGVESDVSKKARLFVIEKSWKSWNKRWLACKYSRRDGSELLIIEPEYVEWDGVEETYPFVFETEGDWSITTAVDPPEGFVADHSSLTADVNSEIEAVQFTITDIGSDWVDTECTHEITHKGKKEKIKTKIGVKLSKKLAEKKGLSRFGREKRKKKE